MTKFILRITLLTMLACFTALASNAQQGFDYSRYDLGASIGFNSFSGDVQTPASTKAINFNFDYNQTPFVNYILEFQLGKLAGGNAQTDLLGRQFAADYNSYAFRIQVQAGELIDYSQSPFLNGLKNLYVGGGIGTIYSTIKSINRYSTLLPGYYTPGTNKANELFFPARIGYELKIFNKNQRADFKLDVGYQFNYVFGDQLDGFQAGSKGDAFSQFTIGFKISVGGVISYRKPISY